MSQRLKTSSLLFALVTAALCGLPIWFTWRTFRIEKANVALINAIKNNHTAEAVAALQAGADPNIRDSKGQPSVSFLHILRDWLHGRKSQPNDKDTALMLAVQDDLDMVNPLLEAGADFNAKNENDQTALMYAVLTEDIGVCKRLIDKGADMNVADIDGNTLVMLEVRFRNTKMLRLLLEHGANINFTNRYGGTALMYAAGIGDVNATRLLLDKGANVNLRDMFGHTALTAAQQGPAGLQGEDIVTEPPQYQATIKMLKKAGAKP